MESTIFVYILFYSPQPIYPRFDDSDDDSNNEDEKPDSSTPLHRFGVAIPDEHLDELDKSKNDFPRPPFIAEISTGIQTHYEKLRKEDNNKWLLMDSNGLKWIRMD